MKFDFAGLQVPVVQAPMAGGINTPRLAAAVANAGGVGSFGFAYSSPQKIDEDLAATKALTSGPVNANFFVFNPVAEPDPQLARAATDALSELPLARDCALSVPKSPYFPDLAPMLEPVWQHRPAIVTFHFGLPPASVIAKARGLGIAVGVSATSLDEALAIEAAGASFVVAQGIEAGGHRGIFDPDGEDEALTVNALVALTAAHCEIPVVAAGGLMTGGDIARVLSLGAVAAQLGTAFLCCDEAGTGPAHREFILHRKDRGTAYTRAFSGRRAQGVRNAFIERMADKPYLPFPLQNTLTGPLRQRAVAQGDGEYQSLWAGSEYGRARAMPAGELMLALRREILRGA